MGADDTSGVACIIIAGGVIAAIDLSRGSRELIPLDHDEVPLRVSSTRGSKPRGAPHEIKAGVPRLYPGCQSGVPLGDHVPRAF